MSDELYNIDLHNTLEPNISDYDIRILRVPGGWIYNQFVENGTGGYNMNSTFVPYNNEFIGERFKDDRP